MGTALRRYAVAALLLRLGLSVLFLSFGLDKFARPANIQKQVLDSALLPSTLGHIFASAIGFWEVGLGVLFLLGLFTCPAAAVAILSLISYTIYIGVAVQYPLFGFSQCWVVDRNVPPDCMYTREGKMLPISEQHESRHARARMREAIRC